MKKIYKEKRYENFRELICESARLYKNKTAFIRKKSDGTKEKISYSELKERYYSLCALFISEGLRGKRIAVIGKNCFEWVLFYLSAATVGVAVPIDKEVSAEDAENFLSDAECAAVCADSSYEPKSFERRIFRFSETDALTSWELPEEREEVDSIEILREEMRVLIFTSGTTGNSKGVCLSQYNICSNIHSTVSVVKITDKDTTLSVLPLHHTYECTLNCLLLMSKGACITYADSLTKISNNLAEYQPSILVVVPALLKFMDKRIRSSVIKGVPPKYKKLFEEETLAVALAKLPVILRRMICKKVRESLGGKLRLFIVGAADLDTSIIDDFSALGICTLQGYGLTECAPLLAGNSDFYMNSASTGIAMPGVELKIDAPNAEGVGEILAKGDNIMLGYYRDEEATARVFRDGWFCTGDLGCMDSDGALYIKGRIKNVIVTENGKNIYPEELETRLSEHPEISESLVVSDTSCGSVAVKAKVFPNVDFIKEQLGHLPSADEIKQIISGVVGDVNRCIPHYKHINVVEILGAALEKTTTQKIKRFGANVV